VKEMEPVPQIVRERLKAGATIGSHPDANVLTAFAEHSLADRERSSVLTHLSSCAECRNVVALALPGTDAVQNVKVPAPGWLTWPAFRWGAVAAGVAIIAVGALQYQRHSQRAIVAREVSHLQATASDLPRSAEPQAAPAAPAGKQAGGTRDLSAGLNAEPHLSYAPTPSPTASIPAIANRVRASGHTSGAPPVSGGGPKMPMQWQQQQQTPARTQILSAEAAGKQQADQAANLATSQVTHREASAPAAAPAAPGPSEQFFDSASSPRVDKAKAAVALQAQASSLAVSSSPQWSISSTGELQRSFDQGSTWEAVRVNANPAVGGYLAKSSQTAGAVSMVEAQEKAVMKKDGPGALSAPVFRAVFANGPDVWAAGAKGALYHSVDFGNSWTRVAPSANGVVLTADIVALQFPDQQHGALTTSSSEVWSTSDGGQTWQKQ